MKKKKFRGFKEPFRFKKCPNCGIAIAVNGYYNHKLTCETELECEEDGQIL